MVSMLPSRLLPYIAYALLPAHGMVLELDLEGNIVRTYQDPSGELRCISSAVDDGKHLYLGSTFKRYIARVPKAVD